MTKGIHHITAIASNAQGNIDFYTKILGLRLVKKSVNQDDTSTYHFFFGDRLGEPGMDLTFFIFLPSMRGVQGNGFVTKISLAVPSDSISFWQKRLAEHKIDMLPVASQFGHKRIVFFDADGQQLELVGADKKELGDRSHVWETKDVQKSVAISYFHSATLSVESLSSIEPLLTQVFGYTKIDEDHHVHLYRTQGDGKRAVMLEISETPSLEVGMTGAGTVHHIAFRADDQKHQMELRQKVVELGLSPTLAINRFYFQSVYFRTPAGILFEIATDGPGFTADEKEEDLGKRLALPPFLEPSRSEIEKRLMTIEHAI